MIARRSAPLLFVAMAALAVSACASGVSSTREKSLAQMSTDCEARGGILLPTGQTTGRDALDNYCRITGGPSDRLRGN